MSSLKNFFAKLSVGGRAGKSELALHSGLIDKATKIRIDTIMQVRNIFAHKLSFINKSFMDYYKSIDNGREIFINLYQLEKIKKKRQNKICNSDYIELNSRDLRHMLWGGFVVTLKCMTQCMEFFSNNKHNEKAELVNAYLSRDYSRETQQKVRRMGYAVISELDGVKLVEKKAASSGASKN